MLMSAQNEPVINKSELTRRFGSTKALDSASLGQPFPADGSGLPNALVQLRAILL
jgi:hypothetical protein